MERFLEKYDIGGGPEVDEVLKAEYSYILRISGLYPYLRSGRWVFSSIQLIIYSTPIASAVCILLKTAIIAYPVDVNLAAQSAHLASLGIFALMVLFFANKHRNICNSVHLILRDNYYKYDDGLEIPEIETWKKEMRFKKILTALIITGVLAIAPIALVGMPIMERYMGYIKEDIEGIDMSLPIPIWHPFSKDNLVTYVLFILYLAFGACVTALIAGSIDIVCVFINLSINFQYKILHKSIEQLQARAENIYKMRYPRIRLSGEKLKSCYMHCIKQNVQHQLIIERVFSEFYIATFYPLGWGTLAASFVVAASLLGFVLEDVTPSVYVSSSLLLVGELLTIAMMCYFGQGISDQSYDIVRALYNTNWQTAPKEIRLSIMIMIEKCKCPLEVRVLGLWPLNYELFASVINTAYSYLNILLGARSRIRVKQAARATRRH